MSLSPPCYFFLFLFTHFLSPTIHLTFVCTKCWCLSYVFSAFGLFSYCLPGLFGSGPAQPVRCFSRFALVLIGERLCLSAYHHFTTVSLSVCLSLSCMSFSFPVVCLVAFLPRISHRYPVMIFSSLFLFRLCILCSLSVCHWIFTCNCLSFGDSVGVQCGLKCAARHVFISDFGLLISGHLFMSSRVFLCQFWVTFFGQFWVVCARLSAGLSWEHHEGEDAKERRTLVVLMEEQEQRLQISEYADTHINAEIVLGITRHQLFKLFALQESVTEAGGGQDESSITMPSASRWLQNLNRHISLSNISFHTSSYTKLVVFGFFFRMKDESSSSDEDHRSSNQASGSCQSELLVSSGSVYYKKTLRLTSEQLVCIPPVGFIDVYGIKEVKTRSEVTHYTPPTWFTMTKL